MPTPNRSALIEKTHKVLKKHYKPVLPNSDRPLLEQLLFACVLENAHYEPAEEVFARLTTTFFDLNEVRVTTVRELSEVMQALPDPGAAAERVRRALQSVFEATYAFELEALKKQNLGQAIQRLEKFKGTTPFAVGYVTQATLGGHAIPLDQGALKALAILGIATPAEEKSGNVTGLERTVGKAKGAEFASLLHQLGADLIAKPFSPELHKVLLEINADAKERLPKRQPKKKPEPEPTPAKKGPAAKEAAAAGKKGKETPAKESVKDAAGKASLKKGAIPKATGKPAPLPTAKKKPAKATAKPKPR